MLRSIARRSRDPPLGFLCVAPWFRARRLIRRLVSNNLARLPGFTGASPNKIAGIGSGQTDCRINAMVSAIGMGHWVAACSRNMKANRIPRLTATTLAACRPSSRSTTTARAVTVSALVSMSSCLCASALPAWARCRRFRYLCRSNPRTSRGLVASLRQPAARAARAGRRALPAAFAIGP